MNPYLKRLYNLSKTSRRRILGLMSGTSMDGLDVALCRFSGSGKDTKWDLEAFVTAPWPPGLHERLLGFLNSGEQGFRDVCLWNAYLGRLFAGMVRETLKEWDVLPGKVDLIASHGQTVFHAPRRYHRIPDMPDATLQIADGDHIASGTGIITISDFRQRDTARGGEGAPLAGYADYLMFQDPLKHRILLNIGGIANFTWLPAHSDLFPPLSYDTGPGNTLIDAAVRRYLQGLWFDRDGEIARKGCVNPALLSRLQEHPYFGLAPPKTTGFETFNMEWVDAAARDLSCPLSPEDLIATLTQLTVDTIIMEIRRVLPESAGAEILVSGGGARNRTILQKLVDGFAPVPVRLLEEVGLNGDAKEAVLFAVLANELVCGSDTRLHLGKISFPDHSI